MVWMLLRTVEFFRVGRASCGMDAPQDSGAP